MKAGNRKSNIKRRESEQGMSLLAVVAVMAIFAMALLAVAPTAYIEVQREKELEQIRRGEEIAKAIEQYVLFYRGAKLPSSMDDLLEGLPYGTKKRMILRPSAAIDPLSEDGKWRLIKPEGQAFVNFAKRVQTYNNGLLPSSPSTVFDRWTVVLANVVNTNSEEDIEDADDMEIDDSTENTPFIGVASKSKSKSVIAYYGIENHSKWIYTPLFRGGGTSAVTPQNRNNFQLNSNR